MRTQKKTTVGPHCCQVRREYKGAAAGSMSVQVLTWRAFVMRPGLRARTISSCLKSLILLHSPGIGAFSDASLLHHLSHSSLFFSTSFGRVEKACRHLTGAK